MRSLPVLLCASLCLGCPSGRADVERRDRSTTTLQAAGAVERERERDVVVFEGACDASGAVPIDAHSFAVADDEDNVLRVYDAEKGGAPMAAADVSPELLVKIKKKPKEADFEAATRLGDVALWLTSHARTKKGKEKQERFRFFMTRLPQPPAMQLTGSTYTRLLADLIADSRLAALGLAAAADKPPQEQGGLNIEGMTAMPNGQVLLGFRNPVPGGRALLVPLLNPLDPFAGKPARFGEPIALDLGGLGVRSLSFWRGSYLIAAGSYGPGGPARVYRWAGPGHAPREVTGLSLAGLTPEAFFTPEERDQIMILSDDGSREIDGVRCKDLKDPSAKRFRGMWLRIE